MSPKLKKRLWIALIVLGLLAFSVPVAWLAAPAMLVVDSRAQTADAIVVLGGEPWTRPARAAEVYREVVRVGNIEHPTSNIQHPTGPDGAGSGERGARGGVGISVFQRVSVSEFQKTWVVVSGNGDCQDVRRQLEAGQVPADRILTECESKSTHENALFTVKLLRERHITNAVVVTSWFHSRRALACFRAAAPEIIFYSRPTIRPVEKSWWPDRYERQRITQEYAKIVYYWVVYGVNPFKS